MKTALLHSVRKTLPHLVIGAALCLPSGAAPVPGPDPPPVGISDAVRLAERWVLEHRVDVSGQHVASARLCWDDSPGGKRRYWHVQWAWTSPRLGGEFGARVYMDGTVVPRPCGP